MSSDGVSRGTRRLPINGGTWICSRCDQERVVGSAYCREHRNEYQRNWFRERSDEFKRMRELLQKI